MLDGIIARVNNRATHSELFLILCLTDILMRFFFFLLHGILLQKASIKPPSWSLGTLVSSILISYARARAEGLGQECKTGIMERPERIILLVFAAMTDLVCPCALGNVCPYACDGFSEDLSCVEPHESERSGK